GLGTPVHERHVHHDVQHARHVRLPLQYPPIHPRHRGRDQLIHWLCSSSGSLENERTDGPPTRYFWRLVQPHLQRLGAGPSSSLRPKPSATRPPGSAWAARRSQTSASWSGHSTPPRPLLLPLRSSTCGPTAQQRLLGPTSASRPSTLTDS